MAVTKTDTEIAFSLWKQNSLKYTHTHTQVWTHKNALCYKWHEVVGLSILICEYKLPDFLKCFWFLQEKH